MKRRVDIRGVMVPNDYKWIYNLFGMDATCPRDVQKVVDETVPGDEIEVYINSGGGVIDVGSEIYTLLRGREDVKIYITGEACSAASIVAMAAHCEMSPTALMMVHCVSTGAKGNHSTMEHTAEVLRTADKALSSAYIAKTGMTEEQALEMMEKETWLTAEQAKEKGLVDKIMFEEKEKKPTLVAGPLFELPSMEMMEKARKMMKETGASQKDESVFLLQKKLELLKMRGER